MRMWPTTCTDRRPVTGPRSAPGEGRFPRGRAWAARHDPRAFPALHARPATGRRLVRGFMRMQAFDAGIRIPRCTCTISVAKPAGSPRAVVYVNRAPEPGMRSKLKPARNRFRSTPATGSCNAGSSRSSDRPDRETADPSRSADKGRRDRTGAKRVLFLLFLNVYLGRQFLEPPLSTA